MKLGQLVSSSFNTSLRKLSGSSEVPLPLAFRLRGIVKSISTEQEKYEQMRQELVQKYGEKGEDGKLIANEEGMAKFSEDNTPLFVKDLSDLASVEVELPSIKASELGNNVKLSALDLLHLEGLVDE